MSKKLSFRPNSKEILVGLVLILVILTLAKWTYFFLPDEYAQEAQMPNMEHIYTVSIALLFMFIYKIAKEINEIKKQLAARESSSDANPQKGSK